jgi:hypothetical protein
VVLTAHSADNSTVEVLAHYSNPDYQLNQLNELLHLSSNWDIEQTSVTSPERKLGKRPSRSIIPKLIMDYQAGLSSRQLATKYNSSKSVVLRILKAEGITRPRGQHRRPS